MKLSLHRLAAWLVRNYLTWTHKDDRMCQMTGVSSLNIASRNHSSFYALEWSGFYNCSGDEYFILLFLLSKTTLRMFLYWGVILLRYLFDSEMAQQWWQLSIQKFGYSQKIPCISHVVQRQILLRLPTWNNQTQEHMIIFNKYHGCLTLFSSLILPSEKTKTPKYNQQ